MKDKSKPLTVDNSSNCGTNIDEISTNDKISFNFKNCETFEKKFKFYS